MSESPLVSIVTPSYNQAQFLEETILSVLAQDYANLEHIVIDGGSTDGSVDILRKYADRLAYWVSEPDQGQVDAINKGFAWTTGDILTWLNSDDVYTSPNTISRVVSLLEQYPQVDAVSGAGVFLDKDGHWMRQIAVPLDRVHYEQLRYRNSIVQPATFFKREVLNSMSLDISLHYTFDWDFFIRLSRDYNLLVVNEVWAGYRMWGLNKTAIGSAARAREQAVVLGRYVGNRSYQYYTIRAFFRLYQGVEWMPASLQPRLKSVVRTMSRAVSALSSRRIPVA
jgi:glycosyltransferase involved in cell wall biosynthesis